VHQAAGRIAAVCTPRSRHRTGDPMGYAFEASVMSEVQRVPRDGPSRRVHTDRSDSAARWQRQLGGELRAISVCRCSTACMGLDRQPVFGAFTAGPILDLVVRLIGEASATQRRQAAERRSVEDARVLHWRDTSPVGRCPLVPRTDCGRHVAPYRGRHQRAQGSRARLPAAICVATASASYPRWVMMLHFKRQLRARPRSRRSSPRLLK